MNSSLRPTPGLTYPGSTTLQHAGPREKPCTCCELGQDQAFLSCYLTGKHMTDSLALLPFSQVQPGLFVSVEEV